MKYILRNIKNGKIITPGSTVKDIDGQKVYIIDYEYPSGAEIEEDNGMSYGLVEPRFLNCKWEQVRK